MARPKKPKTENTADGETAATGTGTATGTGRKRAKRHRVATTRTNAGQIEGKAIMDGLQLFEKLPRESRLRVMSYIGSAYGLSVTWNQGGGETGGERMLAQFPVAEQSRSAATG